DDGCAGGGGGQRQPLPNSLGCPGQQHRFAAQHGGPSFTPLLRLTLQASACLARMQFLCRRDALINPSPAKREREGPAAKRWEVEGTRRCRRIPLTQLQLSSATPH